MKCIIIDDDVASRNILMHLIKQIDYLQLTGIYENSLKALPVLELEDIDLVFLDIEMPEMNGIDLLRNHKMPMTIITTMHSKYALEAFEHNIIDYLIKPVTLARFIKAIEKAKVRLDKRKNQKNYFFIKKDSVLNRVPVENILWIEALGDYATIFTTEKKYVVHLTLKVIEGKLPPDKFLRVHRSYIVNVDCIEHIDDSILSVNKQFIPIGVSYREQVFKTLNLL